MNLADWNLPFSVIGTLPAKYGQMWTPRNFSFSY